MRLDTSQQMRTEMRLRMAPRMIQSMEILQLPIMALQERIEQELSENPVLVDLRESARTCGGGGRRDGATAAGRARGRDRAERVRQPDRPGRELERALRRRAAAEPGLAERGRRPQARRHAEHGLAAPLVPRRPDRTARLLRLRSDRPAAGRVHHLQPGRQRLPEAQPARRGPRLRTARPRWNRPRRRSGWSRSSTRRASAPATCASACCCSSRRRRPATTCCGP